MKKNIKELKNKSVADLSKEEQKLRTEIAKLNLEAKVSPQKDTNLIFKKRKRLAVILTLLGEKKESA